MEAVSLLYDGRIKAHNVLFDFTIGEYLEIIRPAVTKNEFQRKRVRGSKSVYSLLKEDIIKGCVIPPILLALSTAYPATELDPERAKNFVSSGADDLVILDGLQRTLKRRLCSCGFPGGDLARVAGVAD